MKYSTYLNCKLLFKDIAEEYGMKVTGTCAVWDCINSKDFFVWEFIGGNLRWVAKDLSLLNDKIVCEDCKTISFNDFEISVLRKHLSKLYKKYLLLLEQLKITNLEGMFV